MNYQDDRRTVLLLFLYTNHMIDFPTYIELVSYIVKTREEFLKVTKTDDETT